MPWPPAHLHPAFCVMPWRHGAKNKWSCTIDLLLSMAAILGFEYRRLSCSIWYMLNLKKWPNHAVLEHKRWAQRSHTKSVCVCLNMHQYISVHLPSGYDIHSSPWLSHGPNRNRWFTWVYLLKMVIFFPWLCAMVKTMVVSPWSSIHGNPWVPKLAAVESPQLRTVCCKYTCKPKKWNIQNFQKTMRT